VFAAFHEGATWSKLKEYRVGSILEPEAKETALIQDFRKLRATLVKEGLFKTSYVYYVWKLISTTMLAVASGMVLKAYPEGMLGFLASAALVALFWQQSGWLSHDFCHNQVFKNRKVNHVLGMLTGNVYQVCIANHTSGFALALLAATCCTRDDRQLGGVAWGDHRGLAWRGGRISTTHTTRCPTSWTATRRRTRTSTPCRSSRGTRRSWPTSRRPCARCCASSTCSCFPSSPLRASPGSCHPAALATPSIHRLPVHLPMRRRALLYPQRLMPVHCVPRKPFGWPSEDHGNISSI
jgi:hypothetical protein